MKVNFRLMVVLASMVCVSCAGTARKRSGPEAALKNVHEILVLGDSITYAGGYVEDLEAWCATRLPEGGIRFLDLGLPSEVVSGLSEQGHAGGRFPRPHLHERLERILHKVRPDLVLVCYGMNDGIYLPFDEGRFRAFQDGIEWVRGMVTPTGAHILHLTPPPFDETHGGHPGYAAALERYSAWLIGQKRLGWDVVDLNGPMTRYQGERRKLDPKFALAGDGIHPGALGHWLMAREVLLHWGADEVAAYASVEDMAAARPGGLEVLALVQAKQRMLKDAWLSDTRHQRPDMRAGLPLSEAVEKAEDFDRKIAGIVGREK